MTLKRILLIALILVPLSIGLAARVLISTGDTRPTQRDQARHHFTDDEIDAGREYYRAYQPGGAISAVLYWVALGVLTFTGVTRRLADRVAKTTGGNVILDVLLVGLPLFLLIRLLLLPIGFYHGFVLEGEFGFRRLELGGWLLRVVKGWGVTAITQLVVASGFFWAVRRFGDRWLAPVCVGGVLVGYIGIVLYPILVLPLFYTITPVPEGELRSGVTALAEEAGVTVADVNMIDASRISGHTNAFFVGIGNRRSIYLYDTLTDDHTIPETLSVVAHEMGHWRHRHMLKGWIIGGLASVLGLVLLKRFLAHPAVHQALAIRGAHDVAIIPLAWVLLGAVNTYISPIESGISRHFEKQADRFSLGTTQAPDTFVAMKVNSARNNRRDVLPHPLVTLWYSSHPTVLQRIAAAEAWPE